MPDLDTRFDRRSFLKVSGGAASAGLAGLAGCSQSDGGDGGDGDGGGDGSDGGGDGGDGGDGGSTTTTSTEPITIASTLPETGRLSFPYDDMRRGYQLGVDAINEAGGINGREVELIIRNDESDAQRVREQLQQIVSNNDVNMIWGSFSSLLATAGSAFAEQQDLPFLAVAFASEAPHLNNDYEWTFAPFPKSRDVGISAVGMLENLADPPQNIGLWELNSSWGAEQAEAWDQQLSDAGYDIVLRETYDVGTSDFSTLISQSEGAGVEALFSNPIPPDGIAAMQQMKSTGWAPDLIQFVRAPDAQAWWDALGSDGAYVQMTPGWLPGLQGGGNQEFLDSWQDQDDIPSDAIPRALAGAAYGCTQTAHQAMQAAGTAEKNAVRGALLEESFDTVLGQFEFEDNGMPVEGQITSPIGQWWEGQQRLIYPDSDSEYALDTQYPIPPWNER